MAEDVNCLGIRNVGLIVKMRADSAQEKFEFLKWDFPADFDCFPVGFSTDFQWGIQWFFSEFQQTVNGLQG